MLICNTIDTAKRQTAQWGILALFFFISLQHNHSIATHIQTFSSDITVEESGKLSITNTIEYVETARDKHGIIHTLPVLYNGPLGTNYRTNLQITNIQRDGKQVPYKKIYRDGKIALIIGSADVVIRPGIYTYTISYQTDRQLQFYQNYDELAWNVTGLESPISIHKAIAQVHLPKEIEPESIKISGFTGAYQSKAQHVTIAQTTPYDITIATTRPLVPFHGLTIYISWNNGIIQRPSNTYLIVQFLYDNPGLVFFLFAFIGLILLLINSIKKIKKYEQPHAIIPRFYPPADWTPLECGYIKKRSVAPQLVASEIVHLAINGYLTITLQSNKAYLLKKTDKAWSVLTNPIDLALLTTLFADGTSYLLHTQSSIESGQTKAQKLQNSIRKALKTRESAHLFKIHIGPILPILLATIGAILIASLLDGYVSFLTLIPGAIIMAIGAIYLPGYTTEGRVFADEIEGFAMYIKTAEIERLKIIGTPPIRTPELFEKYLPFAMALGLEEAWNKQFAPLFKVWEQSKHPYQPAWFSGAPFSIYRMQRFSKLYRQTAYPTPPKTTASKVGTGRFGGGFSGGGRGGGGTNSW